MNSSVYYSVICFKSIYLSSIITSYKFTKLIKKYTSNIYIYIYTDYSSTIYINISSNTNSITTNITISKCL